jgi:hypothetical protein
MENGAIPTVIMYDQKVVWYDQKVVEFDYQIVFEEDRGGQPYPLSKDID